jgi:hypothetical protein
MQHVNVVPPTIVIADRLLKYSKTLMHKGFEVLAPLRGFGVCKISKYNSLSARLISN